MCALRLVSIIYLGGQYLIVSNLYTYHFIGILTSSGTLLIHIGTSEDRNKNCLQNLQNSTVTVKHLQAVTIFPLFFARHSGNSGTEKLLPEFTTTQQIAYKLSKIFLGVTPPNLF